MKLTQQQKILSGLQSLQSGDHHIPEEYIRRHKSGDGISARYFKCFWSANATAASASYAEGKDVARV